MGRRRETVIMPLIGLLLVACQQAKEKSSTEAKGSAQIAGTYNCTDAPNDPDPEIDAKTGEPAVDVWELRADGTLKQTYPTRVIKGETFEGWTEEGAWSAEGDSGRAKPGRLPPPSHPARRQLEQQGGFAEDPFKIEGERLLFGRGQYVCTKTG